MDLKIKTHVTSLENPDLAQSLFETRRLPPSDRSLVAGGNFRMPLVSKKFAGVAAASAVSTFLFVYN